MCTHRVDWLHNTSFLGAKENSEKKKGRGELTATLQFKAMTGIHRSYLWAI